MESGDSDDYLENEDIDNYFDDEEAGVSCSQVCIALSLSFSRLLARSRLQFFVFGGFLFYFAFL